MRNCLNLGSGLDYRESTDTDNWVNVDIDPNVKTDWCGDACDMPYGYTATQVTNSGLGFDLVERSDEDWENHFDHIYSHHSLEHFPDLFTIVDEMARVSKNGATWEIVVPYCTWTQGWGNPHHKILFHENTFRFFDKGPNGIHKRREQDYSIETVGVEYEWNDKLWNPSIAKKRGGWESLKKTNLNVVKQITFSLKVHKCL